MRIDEVNEKHVRLGWVRTRLFQLRHGHGAQIFGIDQFIPVLVQEAESAYKSPQVVPGVHKRFVLSPSHSKLNRIGRV